MMAYLIARNGQLLKGPFLMGQRNNTDAVLLAQHQQQ